MAVPKQKISRSKRGNRRAGNGTYKTKLPNVILDSVSGEYKLAHHISIDGYYNGKKIIEDNPIKEEEASPEG